jgi:protein-S-isoprenylcysteine O-methyltransferase Ste14
VPALPSSDNAHVVAPAPVMYGAAVAVGLAIELIVPSTLVPPTVGAWLAFGWIAISVVVVVSAFTALARAHTAFDARKATSKIVTDGAFRFSRNPTYLALTLLQVGIAFALRSTWVLLMTVPAVALTHWGVILREERYLDGKFGDEYRHYAAKVRRWI